MIYLDNSAIERPKKEVVNLVTDILTNHWGNSSAIYDFGIESNKIVDNAKKIIANYINCDSDELIITSGGSESNSLGISGWLKANHAEYFATSNLEHPSVLMSPGAIICVGCDNGGFYNMDDIKKLHNSLVVLQFVNSEIGTIQAIKDITEILKSNGCTVMVDAVQAIGKVKIDVKNLNIDMMSLTAQKIGGILGCGVLYIKNSIKLSPIIYGKQNNGLRGGTINVPAIAAFGKAVELLDEENIIIMNDLRLYLWRRLRKMFGNNISLNGTHNFTERVCNNLNIRFDGIDNQMLLSMLSANNIYCSAGSACNSGSKALSKTLLAIGLNTKQINSSIRITISEEITCEELDKFVSILKKCVDYLKEFSD